MKARTQAWLAWWLAFVVASAVFLAWPQLDLAVAAHFHESAGRFPADQLTVVQAVYVWAPRWGQIGFVLALLALCLGRWPVRRLPRWVWRRLMAWVLVVILGVGLVVHEALKDRVGRPRPVQVVQMGGQAPFVPIFTVSQHCERNCSFVSGHAAIGFSLMAIGMWATPPRRRRWWLAGVLAGSVIGLVRIAQGGHFLSDIVFSGLAIWGTGLLIRSLWLHWRCRR